MTLDAGEMKSAVGALVVLSCVLLSGCHAARPLTEPTTIKSGRQLKSADSVNWGGFSCAGLRDIGFSTSSKALSLPVNGLIMGQVQIHNRGWEPFEFETPGFRLSGVAGNMDGMMKCPQQEVPAGGSLQCGFVAPARQALGFESFQPFFVPRASATPCFCQQPYYIDPFFPQASPADDFATASQAIARNFAEAVDEVFGGPAIPQVLNIASHWVGDALSLADSIANSIFGGGLKIDIDFDSNDDSLDASSTLNPVWSAPQTGPATSKDVPTAAPGKASEGSTGSAVPVTQEPAQQPSAVDPAEKPVPSSQVGKPVPTIPVSKPADKAADKPVAEKPASLDTQPADKPLVKTEAPKAAEKPATSTDKPLAVAPADKPTAAPAAEQTKAATPADKPVVSTDKSTAAPADKPTQAVQVDKPAAASEQPKTAAPADKPAAAADKPTAAPADKPTQAVQADKPTAAAEQPKAAAPADKPAVAAEQPKAATPADKPAAAADKPTATPADKPLAAAVPSTKPADVPTDKAASSAPTTTAAPISKPADKPAAVAPADKPAAAAADKPATVAPVADKPATAAPADKPTAAADKPASTLTDKPALAAAPTDKAAPVASNDKATPKDASVAPGAQGAAAPNIKPT